MNDDQSAAAISNKVFQITFGIVLVIVVIAFTPLSGWLFSLSADAPTPGPTLVGVLESFECGVDTVEDSDGNSYETVQIGTQCWMASNLNVGTRVSLATTQSDNATTEKWCYDNLDVNCDTNDNPNNPDGGLYQWDEMMQYTTTEGARGICPLGWHIPTDDEFKTLEIFIGMTEPQADGTGLRGTDQGAELKSGGSSGWEGNLGGNGYDGSFDFRDTYGHWWTSSENGSFYWYRWLDSTSAQVIRSFVPSAYAFSVRCLRDDFGRKTGVTIASTPVTNSTLQNGLVGHWTFDGPDINWGDTSSEIKDRSSEGNQGNASGSLSVVSPVAGKIGQGIKFNGQTDFIDLAAPPSLNLTEEMTIIGWIRPNGDYTTQQTIISNSRGSSNTGTFQLFFGDTDNSLDFFNDSSTFSRMTSSSNINDDEWHFFAVVRTGSTGSWTTTFYIDDVISSDTTIRGPATYVDTSVHIGAYQNLFGSGQQLHLNTTLDDVRVYNRALSPEEVAQLYRQGGGVTVGPAACGDLVVEDADGNEYGTVRIGTQCWMATNLNVGTRVSGATTQTDNATTEKYCYDNLDANCDTNDNPNHPDGGLYQWNEAMGHVTTEGAQGICPLGWHIPTDDEFKTLEIHLGMTPLQADGTGFRGTDQGTQLKPGGTSGFEGNLAGNGGSGSFFNRGSFGLWWSSSPSGGNSWYRSLNSGSALVLRDANSRSGGLSVRCLQD